MSTDARPDVFIAEPVGSCTDLKATVAYPLRQMYGDDYAVAPLSVLVDPVRAMRILGLIPGKNFSEKVTYIYLKQLEEADVIVINKSDLLTGEQVEGLTKALRTRFPSSRVLTISARHGTNLDSWLEAVLTSETAGGACMDVDYDTYAEGEALLGWLNGTIELSAATPFDGNRFVKDLAARLQVRLNAEQAEVAHLKMTLAPDEGNDLAVLNLVRTDSRAELSYSLEDSLSTGELLVNLRAEAAPEFLRETTASVLSEAAKAANVKAEVSSLESFRPGRPTPTHRLARI